MTAVMDKLEIGSDALVSLVRDGMAEHENNTPGVAYYRSVSRSEAAVARAAIRANSELSDVERDGMVAEFTMGRTDTHVPVWLGAELASVLFESLNRYAAASGVARRWAVEIVLRATGREVA